LFTVGDTVRCLVQRLDSERNRIIVTLKPGLVSHSTGDYNYFTTVTKEKYLSYKVSKSENHLINCKMYPLGSIVQAKISSIKDYGILLIGPDNKSILLAKKLNSNLPQIGKSLDVLVLDIDFDKQIIEVSIDVNLINLSKIENSLNYGEITTGTVILIKEKYLVVSSSSGIGYVMIADYNSPYLTTENFSLNMSVELKSIGYSSSEKMVDGEYLPHSKLQLFVLQLQSKEIYKEVTRSFFYIILF